MNQAIAARANRYLTYYGELPPLYSSEVPVVRQNIKDAKDRISRIVTPQRHVRKPARKALIYNELQNNPGTTINAIASKLGVVRQTIDPYIKVMEQEGLVRREIAKTRYGRKDVWFADGEPLEVPPNAVYIRMKQFIADNPGCSRSDMRKNGVSWASITRWTEHMTREGEIVKKQGRQIKKCMLYYLA